MAKREGNGEKSMERGCTQRRKQSTKPIALTIALLLLVLLVATVQPVSAEWQYHKSIEIDHDKIAADLTDFPVLISITNGDLAAHAQDDGDDIVFTDGDNSTRLDHEIEYFNGTTGELVAWVRIPSLSSTTDTTILMWYGDSGCGSQENPTGVWDDNYKMVQHLEETSKTDGTYNDHLDSTLNTNDGEAEMEEAHMDATGKIDGADDLDGSDDYVKIPNSDSLNIVGDEMTLSAWIKWDITPSSGNQWATIINRWGDNNWGLQHNSDNSHFEFCVNTANGRPTRTSTISPIQGSWYYVVGIYDGSNMQIYVNGVSEHSGGAEGNIDASSSDVHIGRITSGGRHFNGTIDEVRISASARSGDWISTTYNNTYSPSTFYTVGDEQPTAGPVQPVPDLPAIMLFGAGLLAIAGYAMIKRRS